MNSALVCTLVLAGCAWRLAAETGGSADAERLLKQKLQNPLMKCEGTITGEGVCWHAAFGMTEFVTKYRATKDTSYLDAAVKYYDALIGKLHTSPDGYKGWVGPYIYDAKYVCDVHIGDAILLNPMLDFAEVVLKGGDSALADKYGKDAQRYVDLAKRDLIEKWDKRGTWYEDGPYGGYYSWDQYLSTDNMQESRKSPAKNSRMSLPFNKNMALGVSLLRLYRVTGEKTYREKAQRIFNATKSRMSLFEDHYVWNYWEPLGSWDVDASAPNNLFHWVNVHPYRDYQAGEVADIVEAYHTGVTFSKEDIQRILNTNLKVMWNGDKQNPKWVNSNAAAWKAALGKLPEIKVPKDGHFDHLAGCLWKSLAGFDSTVRELAKGEYATPPSFERKHAGLPVTEFAVPMNSNAHLTMACVLPAAVDRGTGASLVSKSLVAGDFEVALYSADGAKKVADIYSGKTPGGTDGREGVLVLAWKPGADVAAGDYRVRWTLKDGFREYAISVK